MLNFILLIMHFRSPKIREYSSPNHITEDYQNETVDLNILSGAIISGSFQGFDQDNLLSNYLENIETFMLNLT